MPEREGERPAMEILPESVPVTLPDLPPRLVLQSAQQIKAAFDPLRGRILQVLRDRPLTAKRIAATFGITPSLANYHVQVLENAGLVQVVAQRVIRGIVAKYYARTAQVFIFDPPREVMGDAPVQLLMLDRARDELIEAAPALKEDDLLGAWFPHKRLARERMHEYVTRLNDLVSDFLSEPDDPRGILYGLFALEFPAPPALQHPVETTPEIDD
jgi:DNA-binding transcriptional ArsR family regulator